MNIVYLQGYYGANDGGGGTLFNTGSCSVTSGLTANWYGTNNTVTVSPSTSGISVGNATVPGLMHLPDYDYVTSVNTDGIHLTLAVVPSTSGSETSFATSCDNAGTTFNGAGTAYTRISNFSQYEWGAFDSALATGDLALPVQRWLNAPQSHLAQPGTVTIHSPVTCPNGGGIQGAPTTAVAEDPTVLPAFIINGSADFLGNAVANAMFIMRNGMSCGLHSVGLIASGANNANIYDVVEAMGKSGVIDQHSYLANGYYNVNAASGLNAPVGAANFQAYDSSFNNSLASNLKISSPNTKVTRNSIAGSGSVAASAPQTFSMTTTSTTAGSTRLYFSNVANITAGLTVNGVSVPNGTYVKSVTSAFSYITLNNAVDFSTNPVVIFSMPIKLLPSATSSGTTISFASTGSVTRGMTVSGSGVASSPPTYVVSRNGTSVTLNQAASITSTTAPITFSLPSDSSNIRFSGNEGVFADNIIQQGGGWGINLGSAKSVRIGTNFFDNNGRNVSGTGAIFINNAYHVTVCNNTFSQSGLATEIDPTYLIANTINIPPLAAHIAFGGLNDTISLCGNVYIPDQSSGSNNPNSTPESSVLTYPDYAYDVRAGGMFSNIRIEDNTAPQQVALMTPNAVTALSGALHGQPVAGAIAGLTLSNGPGASTVTIAAGSATDATGTATVTVPAAGCPVNLATSGAKGLDTGTVATQHTYFFFVISGPDGTNPTCIASNSTTPNFSALSAYAISGTGVTQGSATGNTAPYNAVYNFARTLPAAPENPLAGVLAGDQVTSIPSTVLNGPTTVYATGNFKVVSLGAYLTPGSRSVSVNTYPPGLVPGMQVAGAGVTPGTTISLTDTAPTLTGCTSSCTLTLSQATSSGFSSSALTFSGGTTVTLNQNAKTSTSYGSQASLTIYPVRYRLVGALYTTDSAGTVVPFTQNGDTFYLTNSIQDIQTSQTMPICSQAGTTTESCQLSVPCGRNAACGTGAVVSEEAFGRIVGGTSSSAFLLASPSQPNGAASGIVPNFSAAPGYTASAPAPNTAYPFRLFTDNGGNLILRAGAANTNIYEVTDGWVFHR